jgi:hypothetical protein
MSEFMLILPGRDIRVWPQAASTTDPEMLALRLAACLRDLDRIGAYLPAAYLETAIRHLRGQFGIGGDCSGTE